ncbi:MAG: ribosomal protein S18-alanine N-acetyltransferase [Candidatus Bathyarchaeales archaeon]
MSRMQVTIEDASLKHLDKLYEVETRCFEKEAFTKQQIASLLASYNAVGLIAKLNGEIVGFVIGMLYRENGKTVGHVLTVDVLPEHRRKGIGLRLLKEIEDIFKSKGAGSCVLEAREDNIAALRLYQKLGYKKVTKLRYYYGNAHGIFLRKDLT